MGVDIDTYRGRIGSFNRCLQLHVRTNDNNATANSTCALKCIGAAAFIGLLLIIAGIEQNPGPVGKGNL